MRFYRIKNQINFWLGRIVYLDICPSWKCNAKCPTCTAWQRDPKVLTREQVDAILNEPKFKHLARVVIEGGEPTLWSDLEYFCDRLLRENKTVEISIITNGFLTKRLEQFAIDFYEYRSRIKFYISLNGIGSMHDESRGVKNVFNKTMKSIKILKDEDYYVCISFVGFEKNIDQFPEVEKIANELGLGLNACAPSKRVKFGNDEWNHAYREKTIGPLKRRAERLKGFSKIAYKYFLYCYEKNKLMPCDAGKTMMHINPDGHVKPCHLMEDRPQNTMGYVYGNGIHWVRKDFLKSLSKNIPGKCQRIDGELCNDCYIMQTLTYKKLYTIFNYFKRR